MKKCLVVVILLLLILGCAHLSGDSARPKTLDNEQLKAWWWFSRFSLYGDEGQFYAAELEDRGFCYKPFRGWFSDCEKK